MITFNFAKHQEHATTFLKEIANELGTDDLNRAGRIMVTILQTLRDRIQPQEFLNLISQLPVYIRAACLDGWKISDKVERSKTREAFFNNIRKHAVAGVNATDDFGNDEDIAAQVGAVFKVIERHVSEGVLQHVRDQLPNPIAELFQTPEEV